MHSTESIWFEIVLEDLIFKGAVFESVENIFTRKMLQFLFSLELLRFPLEKKKNSIVFIIVS